MLLDFNLAQDWTWGQPSQTPAELGGTLTYMAPERLRAVAASDPGGHVRRPSGDPAVLSADWEHAFSPSERAAEVSRELIPIRDKTSEVPTSPASLDPHRADIYSLGMVLLEALTGQLPGIAVADTQGAIPGKPLRTVASAYA